MAPDQKRNKDVEEARLNALQMADLGTARREHISTADDTRQRINAEMDEIERRRHSNIVGTAEQKRAQRDKESLSAWANYHKTADTGRRTEQLDDLMHGQSHRAQLNAALHGNEVARQPARGHARSFSHAPTNHPYAQSSSGRGGGIVGTRSRHQGSPARVAIHVRAHSGDFGGPSRRDPSLDSNTPGNSASRSNRGRGAHRGHGGRDSHAAHRAKLLETRPRRPAPSENYARRLTNPADFMANARASFPPAAASSEASPSSPPRVVAIPKPSMAPKPPRPPTAPKALTPSRATTPKPVMAPKPATAPTALQKSSLDDSVFAIPTSSTTAVSAADNGPGSPSPSRRVLPLENTAGFSSREKAARPKSSDEQQKERTGGGPTAVLLDIDQDVQASAETQVRNLLLSPGMADLTGITFPKDDEVPAISSVEIQAYIAKELLRLIDNCSGYIQDRVGKHDQPGSLQATNPLDEVLGTLRATSQGAIEAISKKVVEWYQEQMFKPTESVPSMAASTPSTLTPRQDQRLALPKTVVMAPELERDQLSNSGIFDNYRTPPRSASGTVTDSSDEKKQRKIDASLLSPKKRVVSSDVPTMEFESLRVSEGGNVRNVPAGLPSLMDLNANPTPSKQVIAMTTARPPILGSMESSVFAAPANMPYQLSKAKADTTPVENTAVSEAPQDAPVSQMIVRSEGPSQSASEAQRPTLVQSSSNILKETSVKGASPTAGSSPPQAPREMKSRVLSGGIEQSRWADPGPSRFATFSRPQAQPQQRPRTEFMSSRHSSSQPPNTENPTPKVTLLGPAPYVPRRK